MNNAIENRFSQRLLRQHLPLAVVSLTAIWLLDWFVGFWLNTTDPKFFYFRLSLATGYVALVLLVVTLSIGAINILRKERNPISSNWRRDVGIWCALVSVVHFIVGWNVHQKHRWQYFFTEDLVFTKRPFRVCELHRLAGNDNRCRVIGNFQRFFTPAVKGEALEVFTAF